MPFFYGFDYTYVVYVLPALIFALYAQAKVQSTFARYLDVPNSYGFTGAEVARRLLDRNGLYDVAVQMIPGSLTDHYDPRERVLRLSEDVYASNSIAAIGVAAHETGHALQHAEGYAPLAIRNSLVPVANLGSNLTWIFVIAGIILGLPSLINIGILFFIGAVLFQIVTLPVEFNASRRALAMLSNEGFVAQSELSPIRSVLGAAAMTYVAATIMAIAQLLRLLAIRGRED
ncbi:zinc metallopeptidase [Caldanaerobius polysaccharolyticus]|uniref:zinc metallopeptidase n=1 Tax=Caldanaerobius polysaccharolyticus TaxID=44256 RepID=UPI00047E501E|nr:zinc metallopeptidase [Caldanaerobius polysaccharolyticus]